MNGRTGEKIGWVGGWLGGFIWVLLLSVLFLFQGKRAEGIVGLALGCLAIVFILLSAPWKHPHTRYWKLMIPIYVALGGSLVWAMWSFHGSGEPGLSWWSAFLVLPLLVPLGTVGWRRWSD